MELTPEERRRIYEEEKERIENEKTAEIRRNPYPEAADKCCLDFVLCAVLISGIIFVVLEKQDKTVNFHALQSIVLFGSLTILSPCLSWIPHVGGIFSALIGLLAFVFWIVLMVKAYQGERYRVPLAGKLPKRFTNLHGKPILLMKPKQRMPQASRQKKKKRRTKALLKKPMVAVKKSTTTLPALSRA